MNINPMNYKNNLNIYGDKKVGNERRKEIAENTLKFSTFLPKPVVYEDIDNSIKKWCQTDLYITNNGKELPIMTLFSNQRFSEYSQTWKFTDNDNNIIMDFKTINRENNPKFGKNQGGYWNIPGDRFYTMKRQKVLDDNGTESYLDYKIKQPFCVDLLYKITIFTNKYDLINEFNILVNNAFKSRQNYISPNGHYMPMILEDISDESEYNIDDRQFYSQSYQIRVMAYIINDNDLKIEEVPARISIRFTNENKKSIAEIEEGDIICTNNFYYKPLTIIMTYPICSNICKFIIDTDMVVNDIEYNNIYKNIRIFINDNEIFSDKISFKINDEIKIITKKIFKEKESKLTLNGYNPNIVYDKDKDIPESSMDFKQPSEIIEIK